MDFIILDRDGVINYDSKEYIKSPCEFQPIPGSLEAIALLNQHGYKVLIVTNQSGIARGKYTTHTLNQIHEKLKFELAKVGGSIEAIFFCPHHPNDQCECRKPKTGMLHEIQDNYNLDFTDVFLIGDSECDMIAALNVGCKPLLVTGNGQKTISAQFKHIPAFKDLAEAVHFVLREKNENAK